jgi:hypothetical protein
MAELISLNLPHAPVRACTLTLARLANAGIANESAVRQAGHRRTA